MYCVESKQIRLALRLALENNIITEEQFKYLTGDLLLHEQFVEVRGA